MVSEKNRIFTFKNGFFSIFWKIEKKAILYRKFLHENFTYRKNGVDHDDRDEKCKKTAISDFFFEILSQRFFDLKYPIFSFFQNSKITNFTKLDSQIDEPSRTP